MKRKRRSGPRRPLKGNQERQGIYIGEIEEHGIKVVAARAASAHAIGKNGGQSSFDTLERKDPEFRVRVAEALQTFKAKAEREAVRRAFDIPKRPIWHRGECVGFEENRAPSDKMLLRVLSRLDPSWAERQQVDSKVQVQVTGAILSITTSDVLLLDGADRDRFIELLEVIAERRDKDDQLQRLPDGSVVGPFAP